MSDRPLPRPVSSTDFYLAAILGELQKLNAPPPTGDTGLVDLREPAVEATPPPTGDTGLVDLREPAVEATPLPEDFPGRDALIAAGYTVLEMVPRKGKDLTAVSGIGPVTANQILTWFEVRK